ncbi:MAG: RluA family pseudouridine synthase, partial [Rhodospirillales bacterium]|nr:RluA family pseudouridine synthase [Rhodospirillales bacterium]
MTPHADYTGDYTVTIAPDIVNQRLDRALSLAFAAGRDATTPVLSRSRIKALIEAGRVTCGERIVSDPAQRVKPGQVFTLHVPAAAPAAPAAQALPLDVVYEDDQVIVVDKSPGLVVHPAPGSPDRTLVNALIAHCGASLSGIGG